MSPVDVIVLKFEGALELNTLYVTVITVILEILSLDVQMQYST